MLNDYQNISVHELDSLDEDQDESLISLELDQCLSVRAHMCMLVCVVLCM